jgi:hypothetical protein
MNRCRAFTPKNGQNAAAVTINLWPNGLRLRDDNRQRNRQFGNVGANHADLQRPPHRRKRYDFGEVRVAMLTLLTLTTLSE